MKELFIIIALFAVYSMILFHGHKEPFPTVYWSTSKDQCVKIIKNDIECGCENIPAKYRKVWVE